VYLVDEMHMLTDAAFNALLKTLEEPPGHVIFVLATTEPHRIPPTISSRCQRFDFRRASISALVERLSEITAGEGIVVAEGGLDLIARQAGGSFRDAVNLLDQLVAYHGRELGLESVQRGLGLVADDRASALVSAAVTRDLPGGLSILSSVRDDGIEVRAFVREVVRILRMLLHLRAGAREELGLSDTQYSELQPLADATQAADIVGALRALGEIDFAGDAYDVLPAEIAFASFVIGLSEESDAFTDPASVASSVPLEQQEHVESVQVHTAQRQKRSQSRVAQQATQRTEAVSISSETQGSSSKTERRVPPPPLLPEDDNSSPELVALRDRHAEIRDAARAQHQTAGALLNSRCYIKSFDGETVEIGFQSQLLVEKALGDPAVLLAMSDAVGGIAGCPVKVVPMVWDVLQGNVPRASTVTNASGDQNRVSKIGGGHLLDEARKLGAVPIED
jgi:DNA polymerase III gamma/tau subunit